MKEPTTLPRSRATSLGGGVGTGAAATGAATGLAMAATLLAKRTVEKIWAFILIVAW